MRLLLLILFAAAVGVAAWQLLGEQAQETDLGHRFDPHTGEIVRGPRVLQGATDDAPRIGVMGRDPAPRKMLPPITDLLTQEIELPASEVDFTGSDVLAFTAKIAPVRFLSGAEQARFEGLTFEESATGKQPAGVDMHMLMHFAEQGGFEIKRGPTFLMIFDPEATRRARPSGGSLVEPPK